MTRGALIVFLMMPKVFGAEMSRAGRPEARVIEGVERLDPELGVARTADAEPLHQHQIEVRVAGCARDAHRAVAERAERRRRERG